MSAKNENQMILYRSEDGESEVRLKAMDGSVWLSQLEIAELFDTTKQNISLHIKNILDEGELSELSAVKESLTTASDGKRYRTKHYNLYMILAVGYRVRSPRGIQFRQWATRNLAEYLQKGLLMDDENQIVQQAVGQIPWSHNFAWLGGSLALQNFVAGEPS